MQFVNEVVAEKTSGRAQVRDEIAVVARVIPQERVKTAGERASVRERVRQFEVEVLRADPGDRQIGDTESEAPNKRRKQEAIQTRMPLGTSLSAMARATRERSRWMTLPSLRQGPKGNERECQMRSWTTSCLK